jgi:acyl-homoserine lactone acylase PvdQ
MIRETIGDELKAGMENVADNYYYFIDHYFEAFTAGKSLLFDDVTTRDKAEFREMIFDRAFLKAMRLLNNSRGPVMEEWMWGRMHTGSFAIPLIREDSLIAEWVFENEAVPASGGFSTPYRASFEERNGFAVKEVTALSGILEPDSMAISSSCGYSLNPFSEFYEGYRENRQFSNTKASEWIHRFSLVPAR